MGYDKHKQLVFRYVQAWWSSEKTAIMEGDQEFLNCSGAMVHSPSVKQLLLDLWRACPDLTLHIDDMLNEGPYVVVWWTLIGTDTQGYQGRLPTGKQINLSGVQRFRCEGSKVIEEWETIDRLDLLLQLGFVCLPKPPTITLRRPGSAI